MRGAWPSLTGAAVRAVDRAHRLGCEGLPPGDVVSDGGCEIEVIATPGHTADSVSPATCAPTRRVLDRRHRARPRHHGDRPDDGSLGDYLARSASCARWPTPPTLTTLLPGHGPLVASPGGSSRFLSNAPRGAARRDRAALAAGDRTRAEIVARVYADVDRALWPFAEISVRAQLAYLADRGELPADLSSEPNRDRLRRSRSGSTSSTDLADRWIQPLVAKSASALLTVSREAPTS